MTATTRRSVAHPNRRRRRCGLVAVDTSLVIAPSVWSLRDKRIDIWQFFGIRKTRVELAVIGHRATPILGAPPEGPRIDLEDS